MSSLVPQIGHPVALCKVLIIISQSNLYLTFIIFVMQPLKIFFEKLNTDGDKSLHIELEAKISPHDKKSTF